MAPSPPLPDASWRTAVYFFEQRGSAVVLVKLQGTGACRRTCHTCCGDRFPSRGPGEMPAPALLEAWEGHEPIVAARAGRPAIAVEGWTAGDGPGRAG